MASVNLNNAVFVKSAASKAQLIKSSLPQIVFAGKSNVGKSSVINCVLNRKNFARVGSEPGKTIHVNYFNIDERMYFVDLPGYGYAKVNRNEKERWSELMETYFASSDSMALGVFIVDARHKPTADDITMCEWFKSSEKPFVIVANKLDKLKKSEIEPNMSLIADTFGIDRGVILPFSAEKRLGKEDLISLITKNI